MNSKFKKQNFIFQIKCSKIKRILWYTVLMRVWGKRYSYLIELEGWFVIQRKLKIHPLTQQNHVYKAICYGNKRWKLKRPLNKKTCNQYYILLELYKCVWWFYRKAESGSCAEKVHIRKEKMIIVFRIWITVYAGHWREQKT